MIYTINIQYPHLVRSDAPLLLDGLGQLQLHYLLLPLQEHVILEVHPIRILVRKIVIIFIQHNITVTKLYLSFESHQLLHQLFILLLYRPKLRLRTAQGKLESLILVLNRLKILFQR